MNNPLFHKSNLQIKVILIIVTMKAIENTLQDMKFQTEIRNGLNLR